MRRLILLALTAALVFSLGTLPAGAVLYPEVEGGVWYDDPALISGSELTEHPILAERLDAVFRGHAGLYTDLSFTEEVLVPLGCREMRNDRAMLAARSGQRGWSCFIYANAVYYTLIGEEAEEWMGIREKSEVLLGEISGTPDTLYEAFCSAGVGQLAYCRTGSHSFLILGYDENGITCLDGNSINGEPGLVQVTRADWQYFWNYFCTYGTNFVRKVVQPTPETLARMLAVPKPAELELKKQDVT